MGHRANLVLVESGIPTVRYDHWAAHDLSGHLVLGPEYTMRWVRQQERVDEQENGGWLDELWAEGGLTMEPERRRLVWYDLPAGQDLDRRRVVAALLARTWPGWTVEWAYDGLSDLAAAAGVPRERVRHPDIAALITATPPRDVALREDPPGTRRWCPVADHLSFDLVTVAGGGDLSVSLVDQPCHAAWLGCSLVTRVLAEPVTTRSGAVGVHLGRYAPRGGVHVDLDARRVSYWCTGDIYGVGDHMADRWSPDLEPVFLQDRIADHLALTGDFVTTDPPDMATALSEFLGELARTHGTNRVHPAIQALEALEAVVGALGDADNPAIGDADNPAIVNAVNPAIADHHPVAAAPDELTAVIAHAGDLMMAYRAGG